MASFTIKQIRLYRWGKLCTFTYTHTHTHAYIYKYISTQGNFYNHVRAHIYVHYLKGKTFFLICFVLFIYTQVPFFYLFFLFFGCHCWWELEKEKMLMSHFQLVASLSSFSSLSKIVRRHFTARLVLAF